MRVIGQKNIFPAVFLILAAAPLWSQGRVPDLTISKVHNGSFAVGQVGATYTIVVRNIGSAPTSGPVTVTDTLPAGLTATSIGGEGWTCTQPVGPCQRIDILGPRESYSALTLTVNVTRRTGGVVTNTVTVSGGGDSFEGNNEAEDPTDIYSGSLDLAISKRHFGVFTQGQTGATYQIQVINVGQGPTTGTTTVTDTLPAGLTPISINGIGWTCTQPAGPCTRSDALPGGGTPYPVLILTVNVDSTVSGQVTNIAKVSTVGDPNPDNDTALDPTTIASTAPVDLRIRKTHLGDFTPGQMAATYTIVVDNVGQGHTSGTATVTETLPAGLTATSLSGPGWSCQQPSGPCTRNDTLQSGGSYPALTLMVNVSPNATGPVTNVVKVSLAGDTNSNNDTANDVTNIIVLGPDLRIQKSHTGNFFFGQTAIYTLQVDNVGQGPTSGSVSVSDAPPAGLTITAMTGSGWTCAQPAGPCTRNDALAASAAYPPITVTVTVSNNASSNVVNSATVSGGGDTNTNNNTASDPTTILGITGCPAPESPHPYPSNFDFTWTCTLTGTPASVDVTFDALTFVADGDFIYITDANGNNIPGSPFTGTALAGKTVNVPGSVAKIRLTSNGTTEGYGLKVTNIVGVGASTPADLTITKTHTGDFYQAQVGAQYSIVVRNNGSSPTSGVVTVTDTLPAGLSATGISGQGWTCAQPSGPCTRNDALAANSAYPALTLTVNVAVNALSAVANIASVSGGGDTTPANNSASDSTNVLVPTADCQGPLGPLPPGNYPESNHPYDNDATQKWTCVQKGNPAGIAVTFDPASFIDSSDFVSITDKNNNPVPGSPFTADSLQGRIINVPGNTVNITLVSDNRRNAYGFKVTKIASLASPDPDLTLTKTHNGNFSQGQNGAAYTIVVRNIGGGPSNGTVTVTDNVPAGLVATSIGGSGWTCAQPAGPCTRSDALASGGSYPPITLTVNVAANAASPLTNTATVSGGGDTNGGNNNAGDPTTIVPVVPATCDLPESAHPYLSGLDVTYTCTLSGTLASLNVTFDAQTSIAVGDLLYVQDANGVNITGSPFTGTTLAGQTVSVPGKTVKIRFVTDDRRVDYGFKVTNVTGVGAALKR